MKAVSPDDGERLQPEEWLLLLSFAVEEAADGVQVVGLDGRIIYSNRAVEEIFGYSREELRGRHVNEMNADPQFAEEVIVPATRATGAWDGELLVKQKGGGTFPVWLRTSMVRDAHGAPIAMVGIIRDVTERKRSEELVEQERQRLQTLIETSPVGIFLVDASGRILLVNREAQRMTRLPLQPDNTLQRYEQAIVYRRPDGERYEPDDLPLQRALHRGERTVAEEIQFEFPDGNTLLTLTNATPVYSAAGEIAGGLAVVQDISRLEELEQLRSEFLGMMSHELRTPLTAIKGAAATALGYPAPPDHATARELFQIISEQADRLNELIDSLLDTTRIEAGALSISPKPIDLRAVVDEARSTYERLGHLQELRVSIPESPLLVNADLRRAAQVLVNLMKNAATFSPTSSPIIVEAERGDHHVTVHVRDAGRGIPPERLSLLFTKFSRVHDEIGEFHGTGLGLAICKGIVEAHGGRISAESPGEGKGSVFSFTLPLAAIGDPGHEFGPGVAQVAGQGAGRARVLTIDDDPEMLRYVRRVLEGAGYETTAASDPGQVVKLVDAKQPDLVLLDLMVPGTGGFETLKHLREISEVPVIVLTGSRSDEDLVSTLKMGADDYITKPFSPSELLARIEAVLRRRPAVERARSRQSFALGDLRIDFVERAVTVDGRPVSLSPTEYKLLCELATHAGRVLTHDQILQRVWGTGYAGSNDLVRSFVRNVRAKLGDDARLPRYVLTEPQVGYRMPRP